MNLIKKFRYSLSTKKMAIFMFVCTASLLLTASIFYVLEMRFLKQNVTEDLSSDAQTMTEVIRSYVFYNVRDLTSGYLEVFERNSSIKYAIVYDFSLDSVLAGYRLDDAVFENIEFVKEKLSKEAVMYKDHAEIYYPVIDIEDDEVQGALYIL